MKTKGIRLTKDVLDAALAGGTILGGGGGGDACGHHHGMTVFVHGFSPLLVISAGQKFAPR